MRGNSSRFSNRTISIWFWKVNAREYHFHLIRPLVFSNLSAVVISQSSFNSSTFLTAMNEPIAHTEEAKKFIVGAVALNRWGKLEEIQGAAIFLASSASDYVQGHVLAVDGGWLAR